MSNECKIIMSLLEDYIKLKYDYKEYNKEDLFDIFSIFESEVFELKDIVCDISSKINKLIIHDFPEVYSTKKLINMKEEELLNEIADVLLTTARLIKTFNLEDPLIEMIGYKYYRQFIREEKIKNHQKITG